MAKVTTSVMRLNPLGSTNVMVSRLGLGMAALGRPGYINLGHGQDLGAARDVPTMEANARRVLDAAWAAGIRYFDAARSYGLGEAFLGRWLEERAIPPAAVTVGSKWGYTYTADWRVDAEIHEVKEHSAAVLERQWRESSGHLGGYLKVYQIHSATFESGVLDNQEVLDELARLKRARHRHRPDLERGQPGRGSAPSKKDRPGRGASVRLCAGHVESARTFRWARLWPRPGPPAWA